MLAVPDHPSAPTLRPYQADAIAAVERELGAHRSTLLVLPTGTGKTVVFAEIARRYVAAGSRVLVLAHRRELLDQAAAKLLAVGVTASVDQGDRRGSRWADVVVGSVQTLRGARLARYPADFFGLIVVDEAHHAAAASYVAILARFAGAKVLGVTATPDRADGKALGTDGGFETVAYELEMRRAIADGYLAPLVARRIEVEDLDLSSVRTRAGDLAQDELARAMTEEGALHGVVSPLVERAGDRRTLVFGVDVAHAKALAEVINRRKPGAALALDGGASDEDRATALRRFRAGEVQYLVNCALFTEGFDEPTIGCVALARPTKSHALYVQMLGRGTRLAPGKTDCLVLDFVGNSGRHRLVGPADALAGRDVDEQVRAAVEKRLAAEEDGEHLELEAVLAEVEAEIARKRAASKITVLVFYREREVDPFLGDFGARTWDPDCEAARRPATDDQLAALLKLKLAAPPTGYSKAEANALLDAVKRRREAGLCTLPQAKALSRMGVDARELTFARASELITRVAQRGAWGKPWLALSGEPEYQPSRRRA